MRVLAVIPAYNEEQCLEATVAELRQTAPSVDYIVINDGSTDKTREVIDKNNFHALNLPVNTGLTSVFRLGMKYAKDNGYDAVIQFDADGQHVPASIAPMVEKLEEAKCAIVIGSRYLTGRIKPTGARGAGSKLISWLLKSCAKLRITDPTSGLRLYSKEMIEAFSTTFDLAPEPDMLVWAAKHVGSIEEVQVSMRERQGGTSYFSFSSVIRYMSRTCLSIILTKMLR